MNPIDTYTIQLFDSSGNTIVADQNYTFTFTYDSLDQQDVGGGTVFGMTQDLTITTGNSSGATQFVMINYVNCNFSSACDGSCYQQIQNLTLTGIPGGLTAMP
jgi:hypothetical protein